MDRWGGTEVQTSEIKDRMMDSSIFAAGVAIDSTVDPYTEN